MPILREEEGNPSPATRTGKEEEERVEAALDKHLVEERPQLSDVATNRMVLRSHTNAMVKGGASNSGVGEGQKEKPSVQSRVIGTSKNICRVNCHSTVPINQRKNMNTLTKHSYISLIVSWSTRTECRCGEHWSRRTNAKGQRVKTQ